MKEIKTFETAIKQNAKSLEELGINATLFWAYRTSKETGNELIDFNEAFGTEFSDEESDTVGGLVIHRLGRLPQRGERLEIDGWTFEVLRADSRRLHWLRVRPPAPSGGEESAG